MDLAEVLKVAQLVATVIAGLGVIGGGYAMWKLSRVFATKADVKTLRTEVDTLKNDVEAARDKARDAQHNVELLEERLKAVPDGDDIAELRNTLYDVTQGLTAANTKLEGVDDRFERLERWIEATSKGVEWIKNHMIEAGAK